MYNTKYIILALYHRFITLFQKRSKDFYQKEMLEYVLYRDISQSLSDLRSDSLSHTLDCGLIDAPIV